MAICDHADETGWAHNVALDDIAQKAGVSARSIRQHINDMEIDGDIIVKRFAGRPSSFFVDTNPDTVVVFNDGGGKCQ